MNIKLAVNILSIVLNLKAMEKFAQKLWTCFIYELMLIRYILGSIEKGNFSRGFPRFNSTRLKQRVAGGETTSLEQFPFNVQFFNKGGMCGGTILSKKIVVTAAHCFDFNVDVQEMKLFSNSRFVFDRHSDSHKVWRVQLHEKYNLTMSFENDIAIIIIVDEFIYRTTVFPALLCNTDVWREEKERFLVMGYGEHKYGAGLPTEQSLMKTYMHYVTNTKCNTMSEVSLSEDMFCLYGDGKRDTCRGDSGGGVFWKNLLVGITSHGSGCATTPSVYVNVYFMKDWINKTVEILYNQFCKYK